MPTEEFCNGHAPAADGRPRITAAADRRGRVHPPLRAGLAEVGTVSRGSCLTFMVYGLVFLGAAGKAAALLGGRGPLPDVAAAYAVALVCLLAMFREIGRAAIEESRTAPRQTCTCELWWTSMGRLHDDWCQIHHRSKR